MSYQNNGDGGARPAFKATALNEFRMRLVGPVLNGANRAAGLTFGLKKNKPKVTVRTNLDNDKNKGIIEAELDYATWEVFLGQLENAPRMENGSHVQIVCLDYPFTQQGRSKELKPQTKVILGREQDGTIYIAVLSWDQSRPIIRFPVRPSQFNQFIKADGSPMDEATATTLYAPAWARVLRELMMNLVRTEYVHPEPKQRDGGSNSYGGNRGGGGGYNRGGGGGGNYGNNGGGGGGGAPQQQSQQSQAPQGGGGDWAGDNWPL